MVELARDIDSLSNFKRQTARFVERMKETGHPVVLTINGKAELVVQDAAFDVAAEFVVLFVKYRQTVEVA